jgi:DnaJ-class molecular chaperone
MNLNKNYYNILGVNHESTDKEIKKAQEEYKSADLNEASKAITEAMEKRSKLEEKKAVERAVAHVERIRK